MTHRQTVERVAAIIGVGTVLPRVTRPHRAAYEWRCTAQNALFALKLLRPYLVTKANEAEIGIEYMARCWQGPAKVLSPEMYNERIWYYRSMQEAKRA